MVHDQVLGFMALSKHINHYGSRPWFRFYGTLQTL